jgi:KaiC/GvpD/RAD55 family RecA-like ATPase
MTHQTGIRELDRKLGGGIPPGTLVAVEAPPRAQREPLLCAGAGQRATRYFSTIKSEQAVRKQFERAQTDAKLHAIDEIRPESATGTIPAHLEDLETEQDFVVDVVDPIEDTVDPRTYGDFMNDLTEHLTDTDSVGYLHAYAGGEQTRKRQITLDIADFVWRFEPVESRGEINYTLKIPKTNGLDLSVTDRYLEIQVGEEVDIDQTRNIG